jgi:predicted regulator of Ras-like GTPase activity (Roadblock/LC7/MglB family)
VDSGSGLVLAETGDGRIDMGAAAALNTQVVRAVHEVIEVLDLDDHIEDILITMGKQLHFIRPLEKSPGVFLYVALDKKQANLGMAPMQVDRIESTLKM